EPILSLSFGDDPVEGIDACRLDLHQDLSLLRPRAGNVLQPRLRSECMNAYGLHKHLRNSGGTGPRSGGFTCRRRTHARPLGLCGFARGGGALGSTAPRGRAFGLSGQCGVRSSPVAFALEYVLDGARATRRGPAARMPALALFIGTFRTGAR